MEKNTDQNIRPPIVTIMGHVDHGKTTLLDAIRKTNVVAREHGGITQHIGAYQISFRDKPITFIDTPGHAAFEKMRSRGAEVADIVVLVVAANDSVKPQTVEAIKHIKAANKPIIVAITKVDLENINIDRVKNDLKANDILVEEFGGQTPLVQVSASKGTGIKDLLEVIRLVWEINPQQNLQDDPLEAVVIESYLDKNRGPIVSIIVLKGILKVGQKIQVDGDLIAVKALVDDKNQSIKEAKPSKPVEVLGFKKVLVVGTIVRDLIKTSSQDIQISSPDHFQLITKAQEVKGKFKIIVKADVLGSLEAIEANLPEKILIINSGVGEVQPTDINFAKSAKAPILAFNVKVSPQVTQLAQGEQVIIRNYNVIYELVSDLEDIADSFQKAKQELKIQGSAKVIAIFNIEGKKIAGSKITSGKIKVGDKVIVKNQAGSELNSSVVSIKKFKKDVEGALAGQECGIGLEQNIDFREGDVIKSLG